MDLSKLKKRMVTGSSDILSPVLSIVIALLFCAIIMGILGFQPFDAYMSMLTGAFGTENGVAETLLKTTTLIFTGLSYAIAAKCGLINIGAEGQLYMGALGGILSGLYIKGLPIFIHLPLTMLVGFLFGAAWGLIVGALKVRFGANEMITTVMLNYVAIDFVNYMVAGPLKEPPGTYQQTAQLPVSAQLPIILPDTRLHLGFVIAIAFLALYFIFFRFVPKGYEMRVVGNNPKAAEYAGIRVNRNVLLSMILAGGVAGLAGANELLGVQHRLIQNFSSNFGFDGIAVALLGGCRPIGIFLSALLFGGLKNGGNIMEMMVHVPSSVISIVQALVIIFVVTNIPQKIKDKVAKRLALKGVKNA